MARRLLLLFAALLATLALAPGQSAADAQNGVGAFLSPAPTCTPPITGESSCTHPGSKVSTARIAAGCCVATKVARSAYDEAAEGGRHAGFLRNYEGRAPQELDRGVRSLDKQIGKHQERINNPQQQIPGWDRLDPRKQQDLLTNRWPGDIQRLREQQDILRHLRGGG